MPVEVAPIVFYAPGLEAQNVRHLQGRHLGHRYTVDASIWTGVAAAHVKARAVHVSLVPGYHFRTRRDPEVGVAGERSFKGKSLEFESLRRGSNRLGQVQFRRFGFDDVQCVAFSIHFGHSETGVSTVGQNWLHGHYCADPGWPLTDEVLMAAIKGLGVKGYAEPDQPEPPSGPQALPMRVVFGGTPANEAPTSGTLSVEDGSTSGKLALQLPAPYGDCAGTWQHLTGRYRIDLPVTGVWRVSCANGVEASGRYESNRPGHGRGQGTTGDGIGLAFDYGR